MPTANALEMKDFLEEDLYDALRWTFVSAVAWHASDCGPERVFEMNTNFVQARALYEFYFGDKDTKERKPDDARARDFGGSWNETGTDLYLKYMCGGKPANKRVFHLVYGRSSPDNAGGPGPDGDDHIKNQVLEFARDLHRTTERFIECADKQFCDIVRTTLNQALAEAAKTADFYGIRNPLLKPH
jgi:hypothetical protein